MGRGSRAGKVTKTSGPRNIFATVQRNTKRVELQTIATICGATRETIGSVISDATITDAYDDGTAAATDERASESTADSGTSDTTV